MQKIGLYRGYLCILRESHRYICHIKVDVKTHQSQSELSQSSQTQSQNCPWAGLRCQNLSGVALIKKRTSSTPTKLAKLIRLFTYAGIAWTWPFWDAAGLSAGLMWVDRWLYLLCAADFTSQSLEASWSAPGEHNRDEEWHPSPRETVLWLYWGLKRGYGCQRLHCLTDQHGFTCSAWFLLWVWTIAQSDLNCQGGCSCGLPGQVKV